MQEKLTAGAERFIRAVTEFIYVEDAPEEADVIFVPGSRKIEHALRAAELYRAGYAPYVLPSGRYTIKRGYFMELPEPLKSEYPGLFDTEWAFLREVLMRHGVPDHAILREDQATYTWENAQRSRDVLQARGIACRTAILACHAFHARRALLYYQAAMPETRFIVCPASMPGYGRDEWYKTPKGRARVLGEMQRLGSQVNEVFDMMLEENAAITR
ncbi:MAG: YdcF family protein [Clostridiales bacterium]|nr:YdcF family protein [Clostridiales bacterium]